MRTIINKYAIKRRKLQENKGKWFIALHANKMFFREKMRNLKNNRNNI